MVTVVDTVQLLKDYSSTDFLADRGETAGEGDERTLVNLLVEQIEFADIVVMNKVSDATPAQREAARAIIHALNPDARLIETDYSRVSPDQIFDTACSTSNAPISTRCGSRSCTASTTTCRRTPNTASPASSGRRAGR